LSFFSSTTSTMPRSDHLLVHRILPVDAPVARRSAQLHVPRTRPVRDAVIAATAMVHGPTVVTRNVADFSPTRVRIFNPWESSAAGRS
jgi:predicted nucleic acid-binding protein